MSESDLIKALFDKLMLAPLPPFPKPRGKLDAPTQPGVYVLYGPKGKVLYVGLTRGIKGLRPRLITHLRDSATLTFKYGTALRARAAFVI